MRTSQPRKPRGTPTGGQFAPKTQPESSVTVEPSWPGFDGEILHHGGMRSETWRRHLGRLQDPPDGSPAIRTFDRIGRLAIESHWTNGLLTDPSDGSPAWRRFRSDGTVEEEEHWVDGVRQT